MAGKRVSITALIGVNSTALVRGLKSATLKMAAWAKATMAKMAAIAKMGVALAAAAFGVFAYKSLKEFASFEQGMNEVFTLLPGISKKGMAAMEEQTLALAKKMGVIPEEVVPALYSALSAGVPPKNVFQFMETAVKASKAGVVDLNTAVDALSTVVNTYGAENITAARAADIMFEAVKMGKTTFGEMAATMYNVLPIAKAANVSFEDISAAVATMTAKGTPTAQVMTQLKAAIQSMIAPSKRSAALFAKYGLNVKELGRIMAGPGGLVKAMNMIKVATNGDMQAMRALLGSVEAINGVLTLTSDGGQQFATVLGGMTGQAGQATTAFQQMDRGLARAFEKMVAAAKVAMIKFGKALAPLLLKITPVLMGIIDKIDKMPWARLINGFARVWVIGIKPTFDKVRKAIGGLNWGGLLWSLLPIAKLIIRTIQRIGNIIAELAPIIIPAIQVLAGYFVLLYRNFLVVIYFLDKLAGDIAKVWKTVFEIIAGAMAMAIEPSADRFKWLVDYIRKKFVFLAEAAKGLGAKIWEVLKNTFWMVKDEVVKAVSALVETAWSKFGGFMRRFPAIGKAIEKLAQTFRDLKAIITQEVAAIVDAYQDMFGSVKENVQGTSMFQKAAEFLAGSLGEIIALVLDFVGALVKFGGMVAQLVGSLLVQLAPALKEILPVAFKVAAAFVYFFIEGLKASIWMLTKLVEGLLFLKPVFMLIIDIVAGFVMAVAEGLKAIWAVLKWLYKGAKEGMAQLFEFFVDAWYKIKDVVGGVIDFITGLFGKLKDWVYHVLFGGTITKDFKKAFEFIEKLVMRVLGALMAIFQTFKEMVTVIVNAIGEVFKTVFDGIVAIVDSMGKTVVAVFNTIERIITKILAAFKDMAEVIKGIFGKVMELGGKALELAGKAAGAVGGFVKGAAGKLGGALGIGGGGAKTGRPSTANLRTNLKPIVTRLESMDKSLKSIDRTLKGKFVNQ